MNFNDDWSLICIPIIMCDENIFKFVWKSSRFANRQLDIWLHARQFLAGIGYKLPGINCWCNVQKLRFPA